MDAFRLIVKERKEIGQAAGSSVVDEAEVGRLLDEAAAGDFEAFGEIYGMYLDRIYRYIVCQVEDRMTAEDLTEEVFLKAWKGLSTYRGKSKAFLPWLYRITHNHVVDHWRIKSREETLDTETAVAVDGPESEVEEKLVQQELLDALAHLPPQQAQVIILKFIEGLDTSEVARIMKKSQGAIRVMQMRALAALRLRLSSKEVGVWTESYQRS